MPIIPIFVSSSNERTLGRHKHRIRITKNVKPQGYKRRHTDPETLPFNEVLYADDTILLQHKAKQLEEQLALLEIEAAKYGLKFNKKKCEHIRINAQTHVHFRDNEAVPRTSKAKYLGVILEEHANPNTEIDERIKQATSTWNRLYKYWKLGNCSKKKKLQVWNAVIKTKLTYCLVTVQINKDRASRLDAFQLKGIRRILNWKTTYIERRNTNKRLRQEANKIINQGKTEAEGRDQFEELTKRLKRDRIKYLGHLLREDKREPTRRATFNPNNTPNLGYKKRPGRPRNNLITETTEEAWKSHRKQLPYGQRKHKSKKRKFNLKDPRVIKGLWIGAELRIY